MSNHIHIVLYQPEIHANTGNISRTCAVTGATLHLIHPLGFSLEDKHLRRAELDYWDKLDITYYDGLDDFFAKNPDAKFYCFSTKAKYTYTDITYPKKVFLIFGKETKGLPEDFLYNNPENCVRIPMRDTLRSLNLSNSAAIAVYEVLRQRNFDGLRPDGELTQYKW